MMKYSWNLKKTVLVILSALFAVCIMFAGLTATKANANTDLETVTLSSTMQESAEMRLTDPTGMRFITYVNTADLELFNADNVKVVTMITQKDLLDAKSISVEDFNKDSDVKKGEVTFTAAKLAGIEEVDGQIKLIATLLEVNDANIAKEYVAKTYITDGEKIGYIENAPVASIYEVATYWAEQGLGAEDETTQAILDRYTKSCTVTIAGVPEGIKVPYGSKLSETIFYGMPECYTIVSIKDANGADVDKDLVVTDDIALTIEMTANHTWVNGECTVENCNESCYHDWDGADCTICDMTREPVVAETTYAVEYIGIVDGTVTVDLASVNETIVADEITAVTVNDSAAEWTVDDNGALVITTATYGENVKVAITVANATEYKTVTFMTIVATNVLSDTTAFQSYLKNDHSNTLAVLTTNITLPSSEFYTTKTCSNFSIIGVGESKPVISSWTESMGIIRYGCTNVTLKNFKIDGLRATASIFGRGWKGTANIIDVDVNAFFTGGTRNAWLFYNPSDFTLNMSGCTFNITLDAVRYSEVVYLASVNGNVANLDSANTYNISNTTITTPGTIGEHGSNFTFTNCNIQETAKVTYADEYVTTDKTTITIDASKFDKTVTGVTSAIVDGTTCSASQSGDTISISSSIYGEKNVKLVTANKIYVFDTIIATHVLTDQSNFTTYWEGSTKSNSYAVAANDISIVLTGSDQIKSGYCANFTFNGLNHTIGTFYEYSGLASTNGFNNATFKNMTFKTETFGTIFGNDCLGTITLENVTLKCYNKGDDTRPLLVSTVRGGTIINLINSSIEITRKSGQLDNGDSLHKVCTCHPGTITVNLVNSKISTNGTFGAISSEYKLDATSSITDKNGAVSVA